MKLVLDRVIKNRPLLSCAVLFALGIIIAYSSIILSLPFYLILIVQFLFLLKLFFLFTKKKLIVFVFLIILVGSISMYWQEAKYKSLDSLANFNGINNLKIVAAVKEDMSSLQGNKVILKPYYINEKEVKYGFIQLDKHYLTYPLHNGDIISLSLTLYEPAREMNPGGFSNYEYLKKKGIYSQGYYEGGLKYIGRIDNFFLDSIIKLKYHLLELIDQTAVKPYNELFKALLLGERDGLPEFWEEYFTLAGINHLLAISGLHVGFVVVIFLYLFNSLKVPQGIRNFILSFIIILYIVITGFRASVFRAGFVSLAVLWAPFFQRKADILNIIGMTAFFNLIINPYQLFEPGFQLSYLVIMVIILWTDILENFLPQVVSVSTAALLASSSLTGYYFNLFTPVGIIANLLIIPLLGVIVSIAIIGLILGLFHPLFSYIAFSILIYPIKILLFISKLLTMIPFGHWEVATPSIIIVFFWIALLFILPFLLRKKIIPFNELKRKKRLFYISIISFLLILFLIIGPLFNRQLEVTFLSVGQGDSILLSSPANNHVLIDGGGYLGIDTTQGEYTILPYLKYKGIREIDIVFITHFDADHAIGILDIIGKRDINLLVFPVNFERNEIAERIITKANENSIPIVLSQIGDYFIVDDVILRVLNPDPDYIKLSRNENSLVIKVEYHNFSVLLTGDLEKEGERRLINRGIPIKSDILKLGHHGSNGSSSDFFLKKVSPEHGIISVGRNNYGHPGEEVLLRSLEHDIILWRTDKQGAVKICTDGYNYNIAPYLK